MIFKTIIEEKSGDFAGFDENGWWTSTTPKLYPETSSLEGIKQFNEDLDISGYKMIDVELKRLD